MGIFDFASDAFNGFRDSVLDPVLSVPKGILGFADNLGRSAVGLVNAGASAVNNIGTGLGNLGTGVGQGARDGLPALGRGVGDAVGGLGNLLSSPLTPIVILVGGAFFVSTVLKK